MKTRGGEEKSHSHQRERPGLGWIQSGCGGLVEITIPSPSFGADGTVMSGGSPASGGTFTSER
jgi:hypothetical protein